MEVGLEKLNRQSPELGLVSLRLRLDVVGANNWPALMDPGSTSPTPWPWLNYILIAVYLGCTNGGY
jgi:hypothetical protein